MRSSKIYPLIFLSVTLACSHTAQTQNGDSKDKTNENVVNSAKPETSEASRRKLQKRVEDIAAAAKGKVGVWAEVYETGERVALLPNERFPMQSVYKLPIAMAFLKQTDEGKFTLEQKISVEKSDFVRQGMASAIRDKNPNGATLTAAEIIKYAVADSDGTASDVLFKLVGGADAMSKYLSEIGVGEMVAADSEKQIGRDWETQYRNYSTPEAAVKLLRALYERKNLSEASQKYVLQTMVDATTGPKRLKGLLPDGTVVAHKTGTSGSRNGITAATNDIGIVNLPNGKHLLIAVFVSDSPASVEIREETIAKIARAAWDEWSK